MLLRDLCEKRGVSGDEGEIRAKLRELAAPLCDEILVDALGNLICHKKGTGPRVMIAAHMDEVGLMIRGADDAGLLKFDSVGGVDPRVLVSKAVLVGPDRIPGIIGAKAIHLQTESEFKAALKMSQLYIDIGCDKKDEAEAKVKVGDTAVFASDYVAFGDGFVKAKALDDRGGCYVALQALEGSYACDLYVVFTTQEEVGTRGAKVAARRIAPDWALVLECTAANDVADVEPYEFVTQLGNGPCITYMDQGTIAHPVLRESLIDVAQRHGIRWQPKRGATGGNDARPIHISGAGVPSAIISVPTRYIHSPSNVFKLADLEEAVRWVRAILGEVDAISYQRKGEVARA